MSDIHLIIQGKGGIGKSLVSTVVAQYIEAAKGVTVSCFDIDQENATFAAYKSLNVEMISLYDENNVIDQGKFDPFIEQLLTTQNDIVIDSGANTFSPLCAYLIENGVFDLLRSMGKNIYIHSIVGGGDVLKDTAAGFNSLLTSFSNESFILWANHHYGELKYDNDVDFFDTPICKENQRQIKAIIHLKKMNEQTFGNDLKELNIRRLTLKEALISEEIKLMSKQRLKMIFSGIYEQLDEVKWA